MKFSEIIKQTSELLQQRGRLSYRTLRLEFELEEEQLDVLKEQLIEIEALAVDQDGKMLVWVGNAEEDKGTGIRDKGEAEGKADGATGRLGEPATLTPPPASYTPSHLADRIRAVKVTDGERKTITALFADLKGSTALIEGLDPEEARTVIDPALQLMMDAVHQYDGFVAQAKAGQGQIVGVMGEPGLGKSRLFYEFKLLALGGCLVLDAYSVSHGKATAYLPMIELLKSYFEIKSEDDERKRREKVNGKVLTLDRSLEDTLPYLFALLGIEEQPSPLAQMDAQIRRRRTFEALKKLFLRKSLNQPLVLIFEDLHWIDGETQELLDVLSESVASARILLLTNYRPEYQHEWGQKTYYTQLRLAPFGKEEAQEFLDSLLSDIGSPLPRRERDRERVPDNTLHALKQLILDKTQGTPFFMEEIVQELREQGVLVRDADIGWVTTHPTATLQIPPTVQGILAARIDRLALDEKALLQQLAVIGRQFPLSLIRQVIAQPEADLYRLLASLQHKEFLYEQPAFPESEYIFKHALTQDVAYGTLLQEQRKAQHERTGQALEQMYKDAVEEHYGELAHHYQRSGNVEKAVEYLQKAGQQAAQRPVLAEAINYLTAALELLLTQPETPGRTAQELQLRLALAPLLGATQGWAAPGAVQHYTTARRLCTQLGDSPQRFPVLWGMQMLHSTQSDLRTAQTLAEEFLQLAKETNQAERLLQGYYLVGTNCLFRGEVVRGWEAIAHSLALYQPQHHALTPLLGGRNLKIQNLGFALWGLWYLGYPEQALAQIQEALRLAHELAHPFSLGGALYIAIMFHVECGNDRLAQKHAEALVTLSNEHGFPWYLRGGTLRRAALLMRQEQWEEGIAQMRQGLEVLQGEVIKTWYLAWLARGYGGAGRVEEGLATVAEALTLVEKNDERFYEAEVWRIKGELTLQKQWKVENEKLKVPNTQHLAPSTQAEAEGYFLKAIEIAKKQQAKSLELRAVMSLVRLRQCQAQEHATRNTQHVGHDRHHETHVNLVDAHTMLSEIYTWFTEGFNTKDLQEAKTLLDELTTDCG